MSEEMNKEVPETPKAKQYVMIVDDVAMVMLGRLVPSLRFLEVEGMLLEGHSSHQFIVNPLQIPKESQCENG